MQKMRPFQVGSSSELAAKLRANDVRVPPPGRGRGRDRKVLSERWITCRFLGAISQAGLLEYPLRVETGERPDLVLTPPTGRVGVEISQVVPQDWARVKAYSEEKGIHRFRYIPPHRVSDPPRSRSEIEKVARGQIQAVPDMENSIERNWVEAVLDRVEEKGERFRKQGFAKYQNNWLVIYDNWSPAPLLDNDVAVECLGRGIFDLGARNPFCKVFLQKWRHIREFARETGIRKHPIPDWFEGPNA